MDYKDICKQSDYLIENVLGEEVRSSNTIVSNLTRLLADLVVSEYSFRILHWNIVTDNFDGVHGLMDDYLSMIQGDIDSVAEILMMINGRPCSLKELLDKSECTIAEASKTYNRIQEFEIINKIFDDLIKDIDKCLTGLTDDIADELKAIQFKYRKELQYKNKQRLQKK